MGPAIKVGHKEGGGATADAASCPGTCAPSLALLLALELLPVITGCKGATRLMKHTPPAADSVQHGGMYQ
jgi:hypothetical protein